MGTVIQLPRSNARRMNLLPPFTDPNIKGKLRVRIVDRALSRMLGDTGYSDMVDIMGTGIVQVYFPRLGFAHISKAAIVEWEEANG